MLILSNVRHYCQILNHHFGYAVGLGCTDALFALAAISSDSEAESDIHVIYSFDVSRAFESLVQVQILREV